MFLADCHTHSRVSPDSNAPMVEMAKAAWEYGLDVMCLTDHCDLLSLEGERTLTYDWGPVLRERKGMLDAFGARVDLPLGLEFGMAHLFPEAAETILRQPGLDFVIGSCHNQDEKAGGTDFYLLPYDTLDQAIDFIRQREKPLALYLFTQSRKTKERILNTCSFGGGCVNDTIIHLATHHMPFGGVGQSGMGSYHGKKSFETFSHYRSIVDKATWLDLPMRYQPYTKLNNLLVRMFIH